MVNLESQQRPWLQAKQALKKKGPRHLHHVYNRVRTLGLAISNEQVACPIDDTSQISPPKTKTQEDDEEVARYPRGRGILTHLLYRHELRCCEDKFQIIMEETKVGALCLTSEKEKLVDRGLARYLRAHDSAHLVCGHGWERGRAQTGREAAQ